MAPWYTQYVQTGIHVGHIQGAALEDVAIARQRKEAELLRRREMNEVSPHNFDLNFIFRLNEMDQPLTRDNLVSETGNHAVVLTRDDLDTLGCVDFIHVSGTRIVLEPEQLRNGDVLILYPEELGNEGN